MPGQVIMVTSQGMDSHLLTSAQKHCVPDFMDSDVYVYRYIYSMLNGPLFFNFF